MQKNVQNTNNQYPQMPYDLIREMFIAMGVIGLLVVILAAAFSTPDVPALTAKQVSTQAPELLVQTALDDLAQQDPISTYGPPYNRTPGAAQHIGPFSPQQWAGVTIPINSAQTEVIDPLTHILPIDPSLKLPLQAWMNATTEQRSAWVTAVNKVLDKATITSSSFRLSASNGNFGPVPQMVSAYLSLANTGLLESSIDGRTGPMPALNRTKSLLLLQDQPDAQYAAKLDMTGDEWGVIKETGNYPGAVWLWYYTMLYQIPPFSTSDSADLLVVLTTFFVTLILMLTPFIPGLRSIPRWAGIYRLIWRNYYRSEVGPK